MQELQYVYSLLRTQKYACAKIVLMPPILCVRFTLYFFVNIDLTRIYLDFTIQFIIKSMVYVSKLHRY